MSPFLFRYSISLHDEFSLIGYDLTWDHDMEDHIKPHLVIACCALWAAASACSAFAVCNTECGRPLHSLSGQVLFFQHMP
jgi:hypothetical protein